MSEEIDTNALVFVRVPVIKPLKNGVAYDPTGDAVDLAIIPQSQPKPVSGDWKTAGWEPSNGSGTYWARLLVGPGQTFVPTAGDFAVSIRIHDNPEIPIEPAGYVSFY